LLEAVLRRDRTVVLAGLAALTLVAWVYLLRVARDMVATNPMDMSMHMAMPQLRSWAPVEVLILFAMWVVMMVAMMVPSVAPLVLLFVRAHRQQADGHAGGSAATLVLGYLLVWTGFSLLATLATWGLQSAALLSPMLVSTSPLLGGVLLVVAGAFQFTPLKRSCLTRCRSPMSFLMAEWRAGQWGTLVLGVKHGFYCVGCCWLLMALLFVAGIMNLLWVAALAVLVLIEKVAPKGELLGRVAGVVLIFAGGVLLLS
jgi:predicted metal-binding membrane protein